MAFSKPQSLLQGSLRRAGISAQVEAATALGEFKKAADLILQGSAREGYQPLFIRGGSLVVRTNSPLIATELSLHREDLIEKVNAVLGGQSKIERLRFVSREEALEG